MAYKFQMGLARMSGSLTQLGAMIVSGTLSASAAIDGLSLEVGGTEVVSAARELSNIATVDAGTQQVIEDYMIDLSNLTDFGSTGIDANVSGPLNLLEGLKQNGSEILSDAGALGGLTTISGSGQIAGGSAKFDAINFEGSNVITSDSGIVNFGATADQALRASSLFLSSSLDGVTTITASVHVSASQFFGNGAGLKGISSDTVDTTTEAAAGTYYVPFVDQATGQDGETLRIAAALSLNPDTGAVSGSGQISGGSLNFDSGAINSDGSGNLNVTSVGDGTATLQAGNLSMGGGNVNGATNVTGSGEIAGATAKFGGLNFEGNKVLTSNDGTVMFGATADQALRASSLFLSSSLTSQGNISGSGNLTLAGNVVVAGVSTLDGVVTMGSVDNVIPATAAGIVASDHLYFDDGSNVKKVTMGDMGGYLAGNGLVADGDGVISLTAYAAPQGIGDANYTLVPGVNYGSASLTADRTWTLPASPDIGDRVVVKAPGVMNGNQIVIAIAGAQFIDGASTSVNSNSAYGAVELIYVASDDWRIV